MKIENFKKIFPKLKEPEVWFDILVLILEKYKIDTPRRISAFLAQVGHESGDFKFMKENLNYSSEGLLSVFKKYFPSLSSTVGYVRNPEKIGSRVYANRMGNGPESSGDGYKFRGRGLIQITGKNTYTEFAKSINKSIEDTITYLETIEGAAESAAWFWNKNNLSSLADKSDIITISKRINGGTNGLQDRRSRYNQALKILNV